MKRVYKSTLSRANNAIAEEEPLVHKPFRLTRDSAEVTFTPIHIQVLQNGNLRVVSAQITVFLEEVEEVVNA